MSLRDAVVEPELHRDERRRQRPQKPAGDVVGECPVDGGEQRGEEEQAPLAEPRRSQDRAAQSRFASSSIFSRRV